MDWKTHAAVASGVAVLLLGLVPACAGPAGAPGTQARDEAALDAERHRMVERQLAARGIRSGPVLEAMRRVPRHAFVPDAVRHQAYQDRPLPIGHGQTISQPYVVGYMTEALDLTPGDRVLEIGTGSGYQAAVLAEVAGEVFTIEIVPELGEAAARTLAALGYRNVSVRVGDGWRGWPEEAPFTAIMVTAAPPHVPEALVEQLATGGRLIVPVGIDRQELTIVTRTADGLTERRTIPVRFVPMTGRP